MESLAMGPKQWLRFTESAAKGAPATPRGRHDKLDENVSPSLGIPQEKLADELDHAAREKPKAAIRNHRTCVLTGLSGTV